MDRRDAWSFGIPILGLIVTGSELARLAGLPDPDPLMVALAIGLGLIFAARLVFLALPMLRGR
jgi:hypothetical protein